MKFFLLFFLFFIQFLTSQVTVDYRVYHRIDTAVAQKDVVPYDSRLFVDGNNSLYATAARFQSDSLRMRFNKSKDFSVLSISRKRGFLNEYITTDLMNMINTQHVRINDAGFRFESKNNTNWVISSERKEIGQYKARKAVGSLSGRNYTVWYTTDIPIPAGPFKLWGLPGLVLEAEDETGDIRFELISISKINTKLKDVEILANNEKEVRSYEEYLKVFKASMHSRPAQQLYDFADDASKKRLEENYQAKIRRYNNFIEK